MRRSLGLEIGATALSWVDLEEDRGRITIRASGVEVAPLESGSRNAGESWVSEAIRALDAGRGLRGREAVVSLPRAEATLRWLSLPSAAREETSGMVELEATQSLPFSAEEAAWDFLSYPSGGPPGGVVSARSSSGSEARQELLLVAARRGMVQERRRIVEGAGLKIGAVSVDVLATAALYQGALPGTEEGAILLNLEGDTATLSCIQKNRLLSSRAVTLKTGAGWGTAAQQWSMPGAAPRRTSPSLRSGSSSSVPGERSDAAPARHRPPLRGGAPPGTRYAAAGGSRELAEALATEVRRTLVAGAMAGGEGTQKPLQLDAVWLTGEGADEELARGLAMALGVESSLSATSPSPVHVGVLPRSELPGGEERPPSLDTALGLALLGLRPAPERLDLARSVRPVANGGAGPPARRLSLVATAGVVAVVVALLLLALPGAGDRELAAAASRARTDAQKLATRRRQLEERARMLNGAVIPENSYLDVLNDVSALAGSDVWLTQFTYDRGRPIVIRGAARSTPAVARLVEGLRRTRHLERVALGSVTQSETKEVRFVRFAISGTLRGDTPLEARRRGAARTRNGGRPGTGEATRRAATHAFGAGTRPPLAPGG